MRPNLEMPSPDDEKGLALVSGRLVPFREGNCRVILLEDFLQNVEGDLRMYRRRAIEERNDTCLKGLLNSGWWSLQFPRSSLPLGADARLHSAATDPALDGVQLADDLKLGCCGEARSQTAVIAVHTSPSHDGLNTIDS